MSVSGHMYIVNSSFACPTLSAHFCSFAVSDSLWIFFPSTVTVSALRSGQQTESLEQNRLRVSPRFFVVSYNNPNV